LNENREQTGELLMHWTLYLLIGIGAIILSIGLFMAYSLVHPKRLTMKGAYELENQRSPGLMDKYDAWTLESYQIQSPQKYSLQLYHLAPKADSQHFVIIAHGYGYTHHGSVKYAQMMHENNFHVILYDERYHGESGGKNCTMGYREKDDLHEIVSDTFRRYGPDIFCGTYGESMGGAAVLLEQAEDSRIQFCITDCTFAELSDLMAELLKRKLHLPRFPIIAIANFWFWLMSGIRFSQISPLNALKQATVPILFVHGEADSFISPSNSQRLYDAYKGPKRLYIAGNQARHTEASRKNPDTYRQVLREFLTFYKLIETAKKVN